MADSNYIKSATCHPTATTYQSALPAFGRSTSIEWIEWGNGWNRSNHSTHNLLVVFMTDQSCKFIEECNTRFLSVEQDMLRLRTQWGEHLENIELSWERHKKIAQSFLDGQAQMQSVLDDLRAEHNQLSSKVNKMAAQQREKSGSNRPASIHDINAITEKLEDEIVTARTELSYKNQIEAFRVALQRVQDDNQALREEREARARADQQEIEDSRKEKRRLKWWILGIISGIITIVGSGVLVQLIHVAR